MRIVLGVGGGIAAYKAVLLLRLLREAGHEVRVIPTSSALKFVGAPTWEALAGHPVTDDVFVGTDTVDHVRFGQHADLVIVAPATANLLAQMAGGHATDLLTNTLLMTAEKPVLLAPAMHTEMWLNPATQENVRILRQRGVTVLDPDSGRLTGADSGPGRLPEPERIFDEALALIDTEGGLAGRTVVVSAGGTREPLDPVRFLGNRSSGRQGIDIAKAAARAGATVHLVACNVESQLLPHDPAITVHEVETTAELQAQMTALATADVLIMVAAVADFRPVTTSDAKIKKDESDPESAPTIELARNPDILAGLVKGRRDNQIIVGFAAETGDDHASVLELGKAKARRKGADLLAVNEVGTDAGFGDVPNAVTVLDADGEIVTEIAGSKANVARGLIASVATLMEQH